MIGLTESTDNVIIDTVTVFFRFDLSEFVFS